MPKPTGVDLGKFAEMTLDLLCVADVEGYVRWLNPSWERALGYRPEEMIGQPFIDFVHEDDRARTLEEMTKLIEGYDSLQFVNRYVAKDGGLRWLSWTSPAPQDGLLYAVARDITTWMESERRIRELNRRLERASLLGTMGEMAAGIAHQINQPFTSITNYAGGCARRLAAGATPERPELVRVLEVIAEEARRGGELIRTIRRFVSRRSTDAHEIDVDDVVASTTKYLLLGHLESGVRIDYEPDRPGLTVQCDETQLLQVLSNLCVNSVEALLAERNPDPVITISTSTNESGMLEFRIRDNGPGIPEENRLAVFEQFHTTKPHGTGMGLSICKSVVELNGGTIRAEPAENGAAIHFTLPCG